MTEKRLLYIVYFFIAFAFVIELRLVAIMCGDYYEKAEKQTVKSIDISAGRADIVDCNLKKITGTGNQIKALITSETDLQDIFENIREEDREKFYQRIQNETRMVVSLVNPVDSDTIYTTSKRYAANNIAQHLIGYTDLDENGLTGIEKAFDEKLKNTGEKITVHFKVNGQGDIYGDVYSTFSDDAQVLSLTIDNSLQRLAEGIAKENISNGSIVIMESKTGKIRAMASTPVYDANNIVHYLQSKDSPLVNKALQGYEPGSVIKPLWASVLLQMGLDKEQTYICKGYTEVNDHIYHCANHTPHGEINMQQALTVSCNCYFIDMQIKNKGFILKQMANQMNFGSQLQLCENYSTATGAFPSAQQLENMGTQSSVCFGQGDFLVTPVHIAAYMNIFANNGVYVYPQIAEGMYLKNSRMKTENHYNYAEKRIIDSDTAQTVKDMLIHVVEDGNRQRAMPRYLSAGGKTGTAQTGKYDENGEEILTAWFCGFYPTENPEYVICITMYDGGESSYSAAPLFKQICDELYYLKYVD